MRISSKVNYNRLWESKEKNWRTFENTIRKYQEDLTGTRKVNTMNKRKRRKNYRINEVNFGGRKRD